MAETAELRVGDQVHTLPIVEGSEGERAIDISKLRSSTGLITLDPGYANSGSCKSAITFIDGDKGILRYRGYSIEELAEQSRATSSKSPTCSPTGSSPNAMSTTSTKTTSRVTR